MNGIVLIETRKVNKDEIIWKHLEFLDGWDFKIFDEVDVKNIGDYNRLLTSAEFWKEILYEKVLIIQHDSGLLREGIDEFVQYDYVGAPWKFQEYGGNGGLSLRSTKIMLEITENFKWLGQNEDIFFCNIMNKKKIGNLAPRNICEKFSVETIFHLGTLGFHAIQKYLSKEQCEQIFTQYEPI